jgi:hypothetical protein
VERHVRVVHLDKRAGRAELPHSNVFVRLQASPLHGVGVFAIRDIPKGAYVFLGDNEELCWIEFRTLLRQGGLPPARFRRIYRCMQRRDPPLGSHLRSASGRGIVSDSWYDQ